VLVTNHVLSGAVLGYVAPSPPVSFAAGVLSHFLLDAVPHWGDRPLDEVMGIAVADGLVGATTMAVITLTSDRERRARVFAGMAGAAFPDMDKPSSVFFGSSPFPASFDDFHGRIQRESSRRMPQEILVGLAGMLAVAALARRAGHRTLG